MIETPAIVTFTNQKGGVGKTTLCATFANYLVTMGVKVRIVDCDAQHSIVKSRNADIRRYGSQDLPYDVWEFDVFSAKKMTVLMEKLRNDRNVDVVLMDSPGGIQAPGLIPMYVNSDYLIVPFHYDLVTVPSTASFLVVIDQLNHNMKGMNAKIISVPNLIDGRVGKKAELELWEKARGTFLRYGKVTSKIPRRADMERFSTLAALDMQIGIVNPVFQEIYTEIFGSSKPYRTVKLSGIQLKENFDKIKAQPVEDEKTEVKVEQKVRPASEPSETDQPDNNPIKPTDHE